MTFGRMMFGRRIFGRRTLDVGRLDVGRRLFRHRHRMFGRKKCALLKHARGQDTYAICSFFLQD